MGDIVSYRDKRTDNVNVNIPDGELYAKTDIQKRKFNTVYQLAYLKNNFPEQLENAAHMLMLPDYFNFLLTGNIMQEYTNATTTGLVNAEKCDWDTDIIQSLGISEKYSRKFVCHEKLEGSVMSMSDIAVAVSVCRLFSEINKTVPSEFIRKNIIHEMIYYILLGSCEKQFIRSIVNICRADGIYEANSWIK